VQTDFSVWPFRFQFVAADPVFFPGGKATNILRGAFGTIFRRLACVPGCRDARSCEIAQSCPYALVFEPRQEWVRTTGPSGMADWPRPFVFRALHLDGTRFAAGEGFHFDVNLFDNPAKVLPYFVLTFRELGQSGIGPTRGRAVLSQVGDLASGESIYREGQFLNRPLEGVGLNLEATSVAVDGAVVRFLTPTELKSVGEVVRRPEFAVLFRRLRDRISNLRAFYQAGPLEIDFEELGRRAEEVHIVRSDLRQVAVERRSSRTGQTHPIGGFVGEVEYAGDLSPFLGYFIVGEWTGVGRQTVWGKGMIRLAEYTNSSKRAR
jgi:hypothetical protein